MSFVYGTNVELLYSLPAIAVTVASATANLLVSGSVTTGPAPCQLPNLQNIWPVSQMPGKALMIMAAGGYDLATGSGTQNTLKLCFDSAIPTPLNTMATTGI